MGCLCSKMCLPAPRGKPSRTARLQKGRKVAETHPGHVQRTVPYGKAFRVPLSDLKKDDLVFVSSCCHGAPDTAGTLHKLLHIIMADLPRGYAKITEYERTYEDEVCKPEHRQEVEEPEPEHLETIPECSHWVEESTGSPAVILVDHVTAVTSMVFPRREMINKKHASSGCWMLAEPDGMPRVEI